MTMQEVLREAYENCAECIVNDCVEAECRWHYIIKPLEKQIPKKPIGDGIYRYCPVCSRDVGYIDALAEAKLKYCNDCGQAIDWSEE